MQPAKQGRGQPHDQPQKVRPCGQGHGEASSTTNLAGPNLVNTVGLTMALTTWHSLLGLFLRLSLALLGRRIKASLSVFSSMNRLPFAPHQEQRFPTCRSSTSSSLSARAVHVS